jgi:hypothetical protein
MVRKNRHDGGDPDASGTLSTEDLEFDTEEKGREVGTYATPWGLRPMSASEAEDLRKQGLAITLEPDLEPDTSLEGERADLASLPAVVATEHRGEDDRFPDTSTL